MYKGDTWALKGQSRVVGCLQLEPGRHSIWTCVEGRKGGGKKERKKIVTTVFIARSWKDEARLGLIKQRVFFETHEE